MLNIMWWRGENTLPRITQLLHSYCAFKNNLIKSIAYIQTQALLCCGSGVRSPPGRPISCRGINKSRSDFDQAFGLVSFISSMVSI